MREIIKKSNKEEDKVDEADSDAVYICIDIYLIVNEIQGETTRIK